jgi:hypothetical protein
LWRIKITKRLEEIFNLPEAAISKLESKSTDFDTTSIDQNKEMLASANNIIDRIDQALPQVHELDSADAELDELANLAKTKFEDLMDLGLNVEARYSGQILQTAGILLGHAISAKQAKIDKKLRMVDLQLKKLKLDQSMTKPDTSLPAIDGTAVVLDRNELLKQILAERVDPKKLQ